MKKITLFTFLFLAASFLGFSQITNITKANTLIKANHNLGLVNPLWNEGCLMTYDASLVTTNGSAFSLNFINPGGSGFKGYPSGTVGNFKANGTYNVGNASVCGLPVKIQDLQHNVRLKWKVSQQNANDADDKWWATINVIFDNSTLASSEPNPDERDYDLVILLKSYEQETFTDLLITETNNFAYWYYARNSDATLKTFDIYLNGTKYEFAVRYKFFNYPQFNTDGTPNPDYDKNDKVHVKFIPINITTAIPNLDHSLKYFIDKSKEYKSFLPLTTAESLLFDQKVANPNLWIKAVSAGYEVYTGAFTIKNDYFYTVLDQTAPSAPLNLSVLKSGSQINVNWNDNSETDFDFYRVYRSVNNGSFTLLADNVRTSNYSDLAVTSGKKYSYYIKAVDRSFNASTSSATKSINYTNNANRISNSQTIKMHPNPTNGILTIDGLSKENTTIEVFSILGARVLITSTNSDSETIDISHLQNGIYILTVTTENEVTSHRLIKN